MTHNIDQIIRRTQGYFYHDGLVEMLLGLLFLIVGLLFQAWLLLQSGSPWNLLMSIGMPILIIAGVFFVRNAIRYLKERVTYPRTGYVAYQKRLPSRIRWLLIIVPLGLAVASQFLPRRFSEMSLVEGALLGLVLFVMGARANLRRFFLLGGVSLLLGLVATAITPGDLPGSALTFAGSGLALFVSGILTFRRYLQRYPKPVENLS